MPVLTFLGVVLVAPQAWRWNVLSISAEAKQRRSRWPLMIHIADENSQFRSRCEQPLVKPAAADKRTATRFSPIPSAVRQRFDAMTLDRLDKMVYKFEGSR